MLAVVSSHAPIGMEGELVSVEVDIRRGLPGIDVVGLLPPEIQVATVFSAAVCTASNCSVAAKALLSFLASPEADATKRCHGMEPARAGA